MLVDRAGQVLELATGQAGIDPADSGFTHGRGVFETLRAQHGVPCWLDRHLARLAFGAQRLGLPAPASDRVRGLVNLALRRHSEAVTRVRITYTGGTPTAGPTLMVEAAPAGPAAGPMSLTVAPWVRNERSPLTGVKCTGYSENLLARQWALERGFDEALMLDTRGRLSEGTLSSVFLVIGGTAYTPTLECGALPGIARGLLLEWGSADSVPVHARELVPDDLDRAQEVFCTNAFRGVMPVVAVDGRRLDQGPVTKALANLYAKRRESLTPSDERI